jgi:ribonuclease R
VKDSAEERLVNEAVLRGQTKAAYSRRNLAIIGLALRATPTSRAPDPPLRRPARAPRADHRALGLGKGPSAGALSRPRAAARFPDTAEHITSDRAPAAAAERDAVDRTSRHGCRNASETCSMRGFPA